MEENNRIDSLNKRYRKKIELEEDIQKEFLKIIKIGKTNLFKNNLLFLELIAQGEDTNVKKVVLMISVEKAKFLLQRLSNPKYNLIEEEK